MSFLHRSDAGRQLANGLTAYANRPDVVVLALPRGGVPVGYEVASALRVPLDVFLVRKLGVPQRPELAMGAIASGGVRVFNDDVIRDWHLLPKVVAAVLKEEEAELARRQSAYRGDRPPLDVTARVIILVDDGVATGASVRAAVTALRSMRPARIIVAVPVGAPQTCEELAAVADEVVCLERPERFSAVGNSYVDFDQTDDEEVRRLMALAAQGA